MPAMTSRHGNAISQRRDRGRVARSVESRVRMSMATRDASANVASHRQSQSAGHQARFQARKLILDRSGWFDPAAAERLVETEQRLEARQPHLDEKVFVAGQR